MAKDVVIKLIGDTKDFQKNLDATTKGLNDWSKNMTNMGKQAGIAFAAVSTAMGFAGNRALKLAGELEQQRVAFKALLGSAEAADRVISRIQKEAARTPFEFSGLSAMTQQLATITKDGDKAVDILMSVGDAIATSGKDISEMQRVVLNLQQVAATGKVTAMDIRQFQGAVPIFNDILKASGLTTKKLQESENAAQLLFAAFEKASQEGGLTFGGLINQSTTFNGLMSTLKDNFDATFREIGQVLLPDAKKLAITLSEIANKAADFAKQHPGVIKMVTGFSLLVAGVLGLVSAIGFIGGAVLNGIAILKGMIAVIQLVGTAVRLAFAATPLGIFLLAVTGIIVSVTTLIKNWDILHGKFIAAGKSQEELNAELAETNKEIKALQGEGIVKIRAGIVWDKAKKQEQISKLTQRKQQITSALSTSPEAAASAPTQVDSLATPETSGLITTTGFSTEGLDKFKDSLTLTADEALAKFAEIGQGFTNSVVTGIKDGTLTITNVLQEFGVSTAEMILTQLFSPITEGMAQLSLSITEIFNETFGQLLNPITMFVGQAIQNIGKMFAQFILQTLGFQKIFTIVSTQLGLTWQILTNNMVTQFLLAMGSVLISIISTVMAGIIGFAILAASAAASAVALIPIIGPVLAPIAYVSTFGLVMAGVGQVSGLAEGSAGLEEDGIHQFSKGEMVIPETFASGIKSGELILGAGDSSNSAPVNVSLSGANFNGTFDSDMAMGIGQQIATAIKNNVMAPMPT